MIAGRRVFGLSYLSVNYAVKHSSVQTKCLNDAEREDVHKGYLPLNFVCIIKK